MFRQDQTEGIRTRKRVPTSQETGSPTGEPTQTTSGPQFLRTARTYACTHTFLPEILLPLVDFAACLMYSPAQVTSHNIAKELGHGAKTLSQKDKL